MSLVRGNPPSAGQISVDDPAHLRRLPTAGNSEKLIDSVYGSATRSSRLCSLSVETRLSPEVIDFELLVRGNPPSAGQISVGTPAHLRRLPTAGNSVKLIDHVNGSATRLPP